MSEIESVGTPSALLSAGLSPTQVLELTQGKKAAGAAEKSAEKETDKLEISNEALKLAEESYYSEG